MENLSVKERENLDKVNPEIYSFFTSRFFLFLMGFVSLIFISNHFNRNIDKNTSPLSVNDSIRAEKTNGNDLKSSIVEFALTQLGNRYSYAGKKPSTGFDCSGFTSYVYKQFGIEIPPSSITQSEFGEAVELQNAQKGDLIFFKSPTSGNDDIGHVGLIVSNEGQIIEFIHSSTNRGVVTDDLNSPHYKKRFRLIRRVL